MNALVVEDSRTVRMVVAGMLTRAGFAVTEAGDGQEALALLRERGKPDVMLVDWNMPVMNGPELLQAVRQDEGLRDVTVLVMTTETEADHVRATVGGVPYLLKPFGLDALREKLVGLGLPIGGAGAG